MRISTLAFVIAVAGCSGGGPNPTPDAAMNGDMAMNLDMTSGPAPDMAVVVNGTKIVDGVVDVRGVTDDNYVIYAEDSTGNVKVTDFTGNNPTTIDPFNSSADAAGSNPIYVVGVVAFVWHDGDDTNQGPLAIWTKANGVKELTTTASAVNSTASPDGKYVAYLDNASGTFADLNVVQTDGTNAKVLVKQIQTDPMTCYPNMKFVGGRLIAAHCGTPDDAGVSGATVTSYDPATGQGVDLALGVADFFAADAAGTSILTYTMANVAAVYPVGGGAPTASNIASFSDGFFTADGKNIIYVTSTNALDSVSATGGNPMVLQANNVSFFDAFSVDTKFIVYSANTDQNTGYVDLFLAPTDKTAAPVTLVANQTGASGGIFGDPFTTDSTQAIFFANADSNLVGDLMVAPVAGGTPAKLGAKVWIAYAAGGAKVAFNDNWKAFGNTAGRADIEVVDAAKGTTATLVATQAGVDFVVSTDKKTLLYSTDADKSRQGLFAFAIP